MIPLLKHFDSFGSNKSDVYLRYHRAARAGPPSENRNFRPKCGRERCRCSQHSQDKQNPSPQPPLALFGAALDGNLSPTSPPELTRVHRNGVKDAARVLPEICPRCRSCALKIPEQPRTATQSGVSAGTRAGDAQAAAIWRLELLDMSSGAGLTILVKH